MLNANGAYDIIRTMVGWREEEYGRSQRQRRPPRREREFYEKEKSFVVI